MYLKEGKLETRCEIYERKRSFKKKKKVQQVQAGEKSPKCFHGSYITKTK